MMRRSEYSLLLEKESVRLKKLRAGSATQRPGMAAPSRGGTRVIRIPHDDRYLLTKATGGESTGSNTKVPLSSSGFISNRQERCRFFP